MERHFEIELKKLESRILEMGNLVQQQMQQTMLAFINSDVELANQVIENDNQVDILDVKIDKLCQRVFALQQPVASDLRFIMSALKINNDLERMGDLAVYVAKRVDSFSGYEEVLIDLHIDEVANMSVMLVKEVNSLLSSKQIVLVRDILDASQALKTKVKGISSKIVEELMHKSHDVIVVATTLILILNQVERICALSNNIAESVYFIIEGKIVKHSRDFLEDQS